jgi:hypothetical protein
MELEKQNKALAICFCTKEELEFLEFAHIEQGSDNVHFELSEEDEK